MVAAQRAFAACDGLHSLSLQQRYLAALHSWQFPADPWRQPATGAAKLRAPSPEVVQRRQDWQAAFASLYDALRSGACDAFYYISPEVGACACGVCGGCGCWLSGRRLRAACTLQLQQLLPVHLLAGCPPRLTSLPLLPQGTKKPFAVFFGAAGVGGRPRLHALLTRSTSGLRALMGSGMALGFAAPLMPADADRRVEADLVGGWVGGWVLRQGRFF